MKAAQKHKVKTVLMAGGVAANKKLRESLRESVEAKGLKFGVPEFRLCTDNAAMVAIAGYYLAKKKRPSRDDWKKVKVNPNWELK